MSGSVHCEPPNFHHALRRLLLESDEAGSRDALVEWLVARGAAGAIFLGVPPNEDASGSLIGVWGVDLSGELADASPLDVAQRVADGIPSWFAWWLLHRRRPFAFSRLLRYVPISGSKFLRLTGPDGARPIRDLVVVPYHTDGHRHALCVGYHHCVEDRLLDDTVSLGLAYAARWIGDLAMQGTAGPEPRALSLSEREFSCLQWMVAGKTLKEVAIITGMSVSNVRYHVDRAKVRAGFATTQQLIAHAAIEYRLSALGPRGHRGTAPHRQNPSLNER